MTTAKTAKTFRFPDPPEREPDDMTSFDHLAATGSVHHLMQHLGNPDTTLVAGEHYLSEIHRPRSMSGVRYPDLLVAFNVNPAAYRASNAYIIEEQGKPPDFVLEIASARTGRQDTGPKRETYAKLGIPEYWRFDETGEHHKTLLAGDRLVDGEYRLIPIEQIADGVLQGYSEVLNLNLRWEHGQLKWYDPETGRHIVTFEDEREARLQERGARILAEADVREEQEARLQAEAEAREGREALVREREALVREREALVREREALVREREALVQEREARLQAEARARELEARLESMGNQ